MATDLDMGLDGHTPGPWVAEAADWFGDHNIVLRDGEDRRAVAAVVSNMRDPVEVAANARLIAAAPELLSQLEDAVKLLGAFPALNSTAQIQSMRETLAKARGAA